MEPFSFFGYVVASLAVGAMLAIISKKPNAPSGKTPKDGTLPKTSKEHAEEAPGVIDVEKEKEIDQLVAQRDYRETGKKR